MDSSRPTIGSTDGPGMYVNKPGNVSTIAMLDDTCLLLLGGYMGGRGG